MNSLHIGSNVQTLAAGPAELEKLSTDRRIARLKELLAERKAALVANAGEKPEIWDGVLQRIYRFRRDGDLPLLVRPEIPLSALLAASS